MLIVASSVRLAGLTVLIRLSGLFLLVKQLNE